jgi:hypothetical protein
MIHYRLDLSLQDGGKSVVGLFVFIFIDLYNFIEMAKSAPRAIIINYAECDCKTKRTLVSTEDTITGIFLRI